ncbi:hypothetical protein [Planctomicrobium piriforme]|uniref:Uncharacterized protein n=1 Tax=Planctomicrobium piriforme TaxID=1576369 RepID=A0A1I3AWJ9_9PLAN|nr:hypothetical protein [Planctomicrobium piriforme]SFH53721.1 hypothetical protein SAMN05421753_10166 [Planctomicrobium piriforme]
MGLKAKLLEETKTMLILFVYLSLLLGAFTMYRRLILAEYGIDYFQYGYSLIEALVLAKVIVLGRVMRLGERYQDRPLWVPTLYKTIWFSLLILIFSIIEHVVSGWLHDKGARGGIAEILSQGFWELLARTLVKVVALVPLLGAWELGRVLGKGKLFELFFVSRNALTETSEEPAGLASE